MTETLNIQWPWEMVWTEYIDEIVTWVKETLPPDHHLQDHELFPGIKWDKRPIFIVDDDTTGEYLHLDFEKMKRWKNTKHRIPTIMVLTTIGEVAALIEKDHHAEVAKHIDQGTSKDQDIRTIRRAKKRKSSNQAL